VKVLCSLYDLWLPKDRHVDGSYCFASQRQGASSEYKGCESIVSIVIWAEAVDQLVLQRARASLAPALASSSELLLV
jgi:hypothetical protein